MKEELKSDAEVESANQKASTDWSSLQWYSYSTISISFGVKPIFASNCQSIGICLDGSILDGLRYEDHKVCSQGVCLRFVFGSSPGNSLSAFAMSFGGHSSGTASIMQDPQRPALSHKNQTS